jgi:hypothetical protein
MRCGKAHCRLENVTDDAVHVVDEISIREQKTNAAKVAASLTIRICGQYSALGETRVVVKAASRCSDASRRSSG